MRLVQVAQHVEDLERATRWYADLLGVEPAAAYDSEGLVFFDLGGVRLLLEDSAPSATLYLGVPPSDADIDETVERLRDAGVPIAIEPHVVLAHDDDTLGAAGTDEWQAFVQDSEGNLVAIVEQRPRS